MCVWGAVGGHEHTHARARTHGQCSALVAMCHFHRVAESLRQLQGPSSVGAGLALSKLDAGAQCGPEPGFWVCVKAGCI